MWYNSNNNQRIRLGQIAQIKEMKDLMDVGILGTNIRDKKYIDDAIDYYDYKKYKFESKERMEFKININSNILFTLMDMCRHIVLEKNYLVDNIIEVDSLFNYKLWFTNHLIPNYHYLPIKTDMSNIKSAIISCKKNDDTCKKIADNSKELFHKINNRKYISLYFLI